MTWGLKDSPGFYTHHSPQIPLSLISPFCVLVPVQMSTAKRVVGDHEEQNRRTGSVGGNDHSGWFGFVYSWQLRRNLPKCLVVSLYISNASFFQESWKLMGAEGGLLVGTHLVCVL